MQMSRSQAVSNSLGSEADAVSEPRYVSNDIAGKVTFETARERVNEGVPRLIFTVTTGRSGTHYLARVLALFRDVYSAHEPEPSFTSTWRAVLHRPDAIREFWLRQKLPSIVRTNARIYAETSHLACKAFLDGLMDLGYCPTLINLYRPAREIALSLLALKTIPDRTVSGRKYCFSPNDPGLERPILANAGSWHDYQLCYWYCLETEARAKKYRTFQARQGLQFERLQVSDLASESAIRAFGERLNLGPLSLFGQLRLPWMVGKASNRKVRSKEPVALPATMLDELEDEVLQCCGLDRSAIDL